MTTLTKLSAVAATLAVTATSAFALETVETSVPASLEQSRLNDAAQLGAVTAFVEDVAAPASIDETLADYTNDITTTAVNSTLDDTVPASLAGSRLLQQ